MKWFFIFFSLSLFGKTPSSSSVDKLVKSNKSKNIDTYTFNPLLIQGKKRDFEKSKDVKKQGETIVGSELFFIDMDFKKRIFEGYAE